MVMFACAAAAGAWLCLQAVLLRQPMMHTRVLVYEVAMLAVCKVLSELGFSQFDTVGV